MESIETPIEIVEVDNNEINNNNNNNNNNNFDEVNLNNNNQDTSININNDIELTTINSSDNFGESLNVGERNVVGMKVIAKNFSYDSAGKRILNDLSFYLEPGKMVLLLGSPGCGKTTLMKALSHTLGKKDKVVGQLTFNGKPARAETHHRDVSYVMQEDLHMACFTVKETLKFSADLQMKEGSSEKDKNDRVDDVMDMLGLKEQQNTVVGNEFLRGISGGQKKRVSIGIELVKDANLYLMDEPTTGLDSTTSLMIMKKLKEKIVESKASCLVSLLQPGVEVTNIFDYLMVMSGGEIAYFGAMDYAIPYFESLGFKLPSHHNPAEFYQEIVDEPWLYFPGDGEPPLRGTMEFVDAYKQSKAFSDVNDYIDDKTKDIGYTYSDNNGMNEYTTSRFYQVKLCMIRAFRMELLGTTWIKMRVIKNIIVGLMLGTLFYNLDTNQTDGFNRQGLLFYVLMFIFFSGFGCISTVFEQRDIFYQQRGWRYYDTFAFFTSLFVSNIPMCLMEAVIFSTIVYWLVGLQPYADNFFYFILVSWVMLMFSAALFRMVSAFTPTNAVAASVSPVILMPFIVFSGFVIKKPEIPNWWVWAYWIAPSHYAYEGILVNEMAGVSYQCKPSEMLPPSNIPNFNETYPKGFQSTQVCAFTNGDQFLTALHFHTEYKWKWLNLLFCLLFVLLFNALTYVFLSWIRFEHVKKNADTDRRALKTNQARILRSTGSQIKIPRLRSSMSRMNIHMAEEDKLAGCYMEWRNLSYEVDIKKKTKTTRLRLLNGINGYVKPGMLLALMGPSGAGKSTLLDVLADRKTGGHIEGTIKINGEYRNKYFTRTSAYVEQADILLPHQTVREHIEFSALNRLPENMPYEDKQAFVNKILDTLNLRKIADKKVGLGETSITPSQRKKVNIGIELAADPQLLFLDEPTSGLDSSAALKVMSYIKRIALSGKSIICTVHQPSTSIFKQFDHLLLLKKGGEMIYFGPMGKGSQLVLDYFGQKGQVCDPFKNPADFILDIAADTVPTFDAVGSFKDSQEAEVLIQELDRGITPSELKPPVFTGDYASSFMVQLKLLMRRCFLNQMRETDALRAGVFRSILLAAVIGTCYLRIGHEQVDIFNRKSVLFFSCVYAGMAAMAIVPVINVERGFFYREQSAKVYRVWIYVFSFILSQLPMLIIGVIFYSVICYFLTHLYVSPGRFFYFLLVLVFDYINYAMLGMALASMLPTQELAYSAIGVTLAITSLFAGFMIPAPSIPKGWKWFYDIDILTYPVQLLNTNEFMDQKFRCTDYEGAVPVLINVNGIKLPKFFCPITSGDQVLDSLGIEQDHLYSYFGIMVAFTTVLVFLTYLSFRFIRYQVK